MVPPDVLLSSDSSDCDDLHDEQIEMSDGEHTPDVSDCELLFEDECCNSDDQEPDFDLSEERAAASGAWMVEALQESPIRKTLNDMAQQRERSRVKDKSVQVSTCACTQQEQGLSSSLRKPANPSCSPGCEQRRQTLLESLHKLLLVSRRKIAEFRHQLLEAELREKAVGLVKCPNCRLEFRDSTDNQVLPRYLKVLRGQLCVEISFDTLEDLHKWIFLHGLHKDKNGLSTLVQIDKHITNLSAVKSFLPDFAIRLTMETLGSGAHSTADDNDIAKETSSHSEVRHQEDVTSSIPTRQCNTNGVVERTNRSPTSFRPSCKDPVQLGFKKKFHSQHQKPESSFKGQESPSNAQITRTDIPFEINRLRSRSKNTWTASTGDLKRRRNQQSATSELSAGNINNYMQTAYLEATTSCFDQERETEEGELHSGEDLSCTTKQLFSDKPAFYVAPKNIRNPTSRLVSTSFSYNTSASEEHVRGERRSSPYGAREHHRSLVVDERRSRRSHKPRSGISSRNRVSPRRSHHWSEDRTVSRREHKK